jgi:hypothetical protein
MNILCYFDTRLPWKNYPSEKREVARHREDITMALTVEIEIILEVYVI